MPGRVPFGGGEVSEQSLHLGKLQRRWAQPLRPIPSQKQRKEPVTKAAVRVVNDRPHGHMLLRRQVASRWPHETDYRSDGPTHRWWFSIRAAVSFARVALFGIVIGTV